ncbi:RodZ domain-containing protein [Carnimonas bestiolae]|uniref:RodZ domain-containing protein n=1 Tax=Carnimonas bestiolae TaxID=3402172 RepID=UPI003EDC1DEC
MSDQPSTAESQHTSQTAGEMLRSARERKGWGLEQAAAQLNLRPSLVNGLETEEYDQLRIPAYRRGYLRAYARLLEISPDAVLKAHDATHGAGEEPIRPSTPIKPIKRPSKLGKFAFRLISLIVVIALIAVTVLWWRSHSGSDFSAHQQNNSSSSQLALDNESSSSNAPDTSNADTATASDSTQNTAANSSSADQGTASDSNDNTSAAPANGSNDAANNTSNDQGLQMNVGQGVDGAKMTASEAEAMSRREQEQQAQNAQNNANANATNGATSNANASDSEQASAAADSNSIALSFQNESWTRITDASGKRVLDGLQKAGSQQTVSGTPPFRLVIGNSSSVSVNYDGEAVDLKSHSRGGQVARFTLGNQ